MSSNKLDSNRSLDNLQVKTPESHPALLHPWTRIQQAAIQLYDLGFNVMPIPRVGMEHGGKKPPYGKYSILFTTRLGRSNIPVLFERSNLAVICGRLSRNLFVLDCDNPHTHKWVGQELQLLGINAWIVETARGGHYWLLSKEGEVINSDPRPGLQVIGNRKYIVAPPSVHPSGLIYRWLCREGELPPTISLNTLSFLDFVTPVRAKQGYLPPVANKVLIEKNISDYETNSEAELSAAMSLAKAGYRENEIIDLFEKFNPPHFAGKKKPADWLCRYLLPKAFENTNTNQDRFETWATSRPWPGRTGETDKRVFLALCHRARLDGRKHFRASVREIADLASISKNTAERSLKRLINHEFISKAGRDSGSSANLYKFSKKVSVS